MLNVLLDEVAIGTDIINCTTDAEFKVLESPTVARTELGQSDSNFSLEVDLTGINWGGLGAEDPVRTSIYDGVIHVVRMDC